MVLLNRLLTIFNFEKALSGDAHDIGNVRAIDNAVYSDGKISPSPF